MDKRWNELQKLGWISGCDVNARTPSLYTPLMWAATHAPHLIEWLLDLGADIHTTEMAGKTAFHCAVSWLNYQSMQKLIDCGADPDFRIHPYEKIKTPFMETVELNHLKLMQYLHRLGVDLNKTTYEDQNALMIAFKNRNTKAVEFLLSQKINLSHRDEFGKNIFLYAAEFCPQFLPVLIEKGFDWNETDNQGRDLFYYGASHKSLIQSYIAKQEQKQLQKTIPLSTHSFSKKFL